MPFWHMQIGLALLVVLGLAGRRASSFGEIAASIFPQIAFACWLVCVTALVFAQPLAAALPFMMTGVAFWGAREQFFAPNQPISDPDARLVWANLFSRPTALRLVVALAQRENADVIAFGEFPPHLTAEERATLLGPYTHEVTPVLTEQTIVSIFSRHPIVAVSIAGAGERPALFARIHIRGKDLTIGAVHPRVPYLPYLFRRREATIRAAITVASEHEACVLVGDFNTVPWSGILRDACDAGVARRAQIDGATWVTPWPIVGIPIDHAFALGATEIAARVGRFIWSDHYPLIVDIRVSR